MIDYRPMSDVPATPVTTARPTREGWEAPVATDTDRRASIEAAFDYRGDVTLTTADGRELTGYIYDRRADGPSPELRMMLTAGGKVAVAYAEVTRLVFSGKDTAAGKSWETWVRKYAEKKARGEAAML